MKINSNINIYFENIFIYLNYKKIEFTGRTQQPDAGEQDSQ